MINDKQIKERLLPLVKEVANDYLPKGKELDDDYTVSSILEKEIVADTVNAWQFVIGIKDNKLVAYDSEEDKRVYISFEDLSSEDLANLLSQILRQ